MWPPDGIFPVQGATGGGGNPIVSQVQGIYVGIYAQPVSTPANALAGPSGFGYPLVVNYVQGINTSGNTQIWLPAASARFNLLGLQIFCSANCSTTAGGSNRIALTDGAGGTVIFGWQTFMPNAAGTALTGNVTSGPVYFAAPYAASAVNPRALQCNLGTTLTNGTVSINAWGFETL